MIDTNEKILKIVGVSFAPSNFISSISQVDETATLTFHVGRTWEDIKFAEANYSEPETDSVSGNIYKQKLSIVLAGDDADFQASIKTLQTCKPIFRIEFDNGNYKLIGSLENYCSVSNDYSSENFETRRELNATRLSHVPAPFLA